MNYYESNVGKAVSYKAATLAEPFLEKLGVILSVGVDAIGNPTYTLDNGDVVYCDKCVICVK